MTKSTQPANPDFEAVIRESFGRQNLMATLGARLGQVAPGLVEISLDASPALTQQNGFVHAGALVSIADSASGYAALSLAPAGCEVLAVELKMSFMRPAIHARLKAIGRVLRSGRTLSTCAADVLGFEREGDSVLVATMLSTVSIRRSAGAGV
ncbi:MAG TPA: PaaI family thioesterase [Thermoanaerobaculia bacterium]|nr:PaaI family thioesterase [Thermoanaerobaculia bacterium]